MTSSDFCGFGDPFADNCTTMFGVDLKKLKPNFGGGGGGSSKSLDHSAKDGPMEPPSEASFDVDEQRQELFGAAQESKQKNTTAALKAKATPPDEDDGEEDVNQLLNAVSIPDFNLSVDFGELDDPQIDGDDEDDTIGNDFSTRLKREEVFSKKYHPSQREKAELEALGVHLGVSPTKGIRLSKSATNIHQLLFGNHSIILKRGPVDFNENECELILLTDGFILAYRNFNAFNPLGSRYEACHFWGHVEFVEIARAGTFTIRIQSGDSYDVHAVTGGENIKEWMHCTEHVLIQHAMRDSNLSNFTATLGWQYKLIRRPGFTTAVTGDMKLMGSPGQYLNQLDEYNESTPLHYALRQSPCNAQVVEALLRLGSDPNISDGEDRSAMYFAQRDDMTDVEAILKEYGGKPSRLAELELRGELFGGVEQASRNNEKRREREQAYMERKAADAAEKAESAQSAMSKAMSTLVERGQKIERMDDKARELNNEAKVFGDLAKQLKGDMKNKKWYQL
jgi:hypothetical protein